MTFLQAIQAMMEDNSLVFSNEDNKIWHYTIMQGQLVTRHNTKLNSEWNVMGIYSSELESNWIKVENKFEFTKDELLEIREALYFGNQAMSPATGHTARDVMRQHQGRVALSIVVNKLQGNK
jgi:hypothetical protein